MKKKLISGIFALAALLTVSSAFYSCKDYDEELKADYEGRIQDTKTTLENALNTQVGILNDSIDALRKTDNSQQNQLNSQKQQIEDLHDSLDVVADSIKALSERSLSNGKKIGELSTTVNNLSGQIETIDGFTKTQAAELDSLAKADADTAKKHREAIQQVWNKVTKIESQISELNGKCESILKLIKQMVTGVEVRAMESPVVGSLILPVDVQSNILAAYYGTPTSTVKHFPVIEEPILTTKDANDILLWDNYASDVYKKLPALEKTYTTSDTIKNTDAGTVYLNLNPNTVDFTGKTVSLVNTQNEEGGITLGALKKSDKVLKFGYTRADDANNFYEAPATLTDIDKCKFSFADNAQTVVNSLKNSKSTGDIEFKKLAVQLQEAMTNLGEVYDVKTSWTDSLGTHYVSAGKNIGTYAVNPLSYKFLEGQTWSGNVTVKGHTFNLTEIPSIDALVAKIDGVIDNAKTKIVSSVDGKTYVRLYYDIEDAETQAKLNLAGNYGVLSAETKLTTVDINGTSYPVYLTWGCEGTTDPAVKKYYGYVNYPVSELTEQIAGYGDAAKAKVDAAADKVEPYYNKVQAFANKVLDYVKTPNDLLQPVVLYSANGSYNSLSADENIPTKLQVENGTLTIYPTSITSELFAPAYKKYVAIIKTGTKHIDGTDPSEFKCDGNCKCNAAKALTDCYKDNGTPKYVVTENGKEHYYCHPAINGHLGHEIGDPDCDLTYCTCVKGNCPNKYCINYLDANGVHHYEQNGSDPQNIPDPVVVDQKVFDGDIRTYQVAGLESGKYTVIYQCLDYSGNIVTKKYYIEVSK